MIKLLIIGRRCAGKTRAQAQAHLRAVHGPLVYDPPADAGVMPAKYVQNHVISTAKSSSYGDRDLVTEVWFADFPSLGASTQTPFYKQVLHPDEQNFVDQASVLKAVVREIDRQGLEPSNAVKVFVVMKRHERVDLADFEKAYAPAFQAAVVTAKPAAFVANVPLPPPGGGEPFADAVAEFWFATATQAGAFVDGPLVEIMRALASLLDEAKSFTVLADEYTVERLRASSAA